MTTTEIQDAVVRELRLRLTSAEDYLAKAIDAHAAARQALANAMAAETQRPTQ